MLRFVTTADTEILATAAAVERLPEDFPEVRCANPGAAADDAALRRRRARGRARRAVPRARRPARLAEGFDLLRARCAERGIALLALGGEAEPDAEMTALSLAPVGRGRAGRRVPAPRRRRQRRAAAALPRRHVPARGLRLRAAARGRRPRRLRARQRRRPVEQALARHDPARPTVGVCFYRSHRLTGNTAFVDALCAAIEEAGGNALAVWSYTLRRDADGRVPALELLGGRVDALIVTMLATGGSSAGDAVAAEGGDGVGEAWQEWDARRSPASACRSSRPSARRRRARPGRSPTRASRRSTRRRRSRSPSSTGACSAASSRSRSATPRARRSAPRSRATCPTPSAARGVARLAVRTARLRTLPAAERRVAVLLTSFPTKHAKVGMAVGLDTPASALRAARRAARATACASSTPSRDGDELMHALIATGGHDPSSSPTTSSRPRRCGCRSPTTSRWYATLPAALRDGDRGALGPAAGRPLRRRRRLRDRRARARQRARRDPAAARLRRDPVGIYHDPELPPTHHYLACYRWLDRVWGADAIVHLGKHGTLEWLPGKMLGALGRLRARRRARRHAARLPVRRQRPRRGRAGQAPRARGDRRPPRAADDARRHLRRDGRARGAARRVRAARGARPVEAAGARGAHLDARSSAPTCRPTSSVEERPDDVGDARRAHRRLPLRGQGHPDQGRPARARPAAAGRSAARARVGHPAPGLGRRARPAPRRRRGVRARRAGARGGRRRAGAARRARAAGPLPRPGGERGRSRRPARGRADGAARRARRARLATPTRWPASAWTCSAAPTTASSARCASPRRGRPAHPAHDRRARQRDRRRCTAATCRRARRAPDARARRRAADRPQLLLRRPARAAVRALVGGRAAARRRAARPLPQRDGRAAADGRARRLGHGGDAHRRATTWPRSSRCSACGRRWHPESRRVTGHRGHPAGGARPPADRRHRAHLRLLPRRLPAPRRLLDDAVAQVAGARRAGRRELRGRARARRRRAAGRRARRARLAARDHADLRLQARAPTAPASCSWSTRATGATTPTSPRSTRPGAATPTAAASRARGAGDAMRDCFGAHRGRGQERRLARARHPRLRRLLPVPRRHDRDRARPDRARAGARTSATARTPRASSRARWPRRRAASSARASPTRAGSRR